MNWLYYLAEGNLYLSIFYLCYCLFLNNETHYTLNRAYLLFSCVAAFILPLLQVGLLKTQVVAVKPPIVTIAPITEVYQPVATAQLPVNVAPVAEATHFTLQDCLLYAYLIGLFILLVLFAIRLYKLLQLSKVNNAVNNKGYKLIYMDGSSTAFSFFNYLFIGTKAPGAETIIKHELVHIRQKHSIDIVLVELLKVINWFNPLVYLLQNSLKTVHEYIADEQAAANEADTLAYSAFLVDNAYGISGATLTNSFFNYNLLKKRIIMLNQQRSGKLTRLKYLVAAPLCAVLLGVSTLGFSKSYGWFDLAPAHEVISVEPIIEFEKPSADTVFLAKPKAYFNAKGFFINEKYYKVNGKTYYLTTISNPNGKLPYNSNSRKKVTVLLGRCSAGGEESLYETYGYKFPDVWVSPSEPLPVPPVPMINWANGMAASRNALARYANDHITYPKDAVKSEITGTVAAKFTVDEKHKIKDVNIVNSLGYGCDEQIINMLRSFPGTINGKYPDYLVLFEFDLWGRTKDYTVKRNKIDDKMVHAPNLILNQGIVDYGPGIKSKGAQAPARHFDVVKFPPPIVKPDPSPPKPKKDVVRFPPPEIMKKGYGKFYGHLHNAIHYPLKHLNNNETAMVVVNFTITADHKLAGATIAKSGGADFDKAALKGFKYNDILTDEPGEHNFIILFSTGSDAIKANPDLYKTPGYAGEIEIVGKYPPPIVKPDPAPAKP